MSEVTLNCVGDIFLKTKSKISPFKYINKYLDSDIFLANLETVIIDNKKKYKESKKSVIIWTEEFYLKSLQQANINIVNIANNHIEDLGESGCNITAKMLGKYNVNIVGSEIFNFDLNIFSFNKINIAIGGIYLKNTKLTNSIIINYKNIKEKIDKIKNKVDCTILSLHWGYENIAYPSPQQIKIAHKLIDMGIDIIIGHHPHYLQGYEEYNDGLIFYSLGNFNFHQFDISNNKYNDLSCILKLKLAKSGGKSNKKISYKILPIEINENYQPELIKSNEKKERFYSYLNCISQKITEQLINWRFWLTVYAKNYLKGNMNSWKKRIKNYGLKELIKCFIWLVRPFNLLIYYYYIKNKIVDNEVDICEF